MGMGVNTGDQIRRMDIMQINVPARIEIGHKDFIASSNAKAYLSFRVLARVKELHWNTTQSFLWGYFFAPARQARISLG